MTIYIINITFKDGTTATSQDGYKTLLDAQDFLYNRTQNVLSYCGYANIVHLGTKYTITDVTVK